MRVPVKCTAQSRENELSETNCVLAQSLAALQFGALAATVSFKALTPTEIRRSVPSLPKEKWKISTLDPFYSKEEVAQSAYHAEKRDILKTIPIHYYSPAELRAAQVTFNNGKPFRLDGKPIKDLNGMEYVMKPDGEILIMPHYFDPGRGSNVRLKHSSLNNGKPVAAAGHISVDSDGNIVRIDRRSGHYKPDRVQLKQFIEHLESLGVDLSRAEISWD